MLFRMRERSRLPVLARLDPTTARFMLIWCTFAGALAALGPGNLASIYPTLTPFSDLGITDSVLALLLMGYGGLELVSWSLLPKVGRIAVACLGVAVWTFISAVLFVGSLRYAGWPSWGAIIFLGCAIACIWSAIQTAKRPPCW